MSKIILHSKIVPQFISKIIPALIFWGVLIFVILQIPYPESLAQANFMQVIPFFTSLYLALIFTFNILLKNILSSSTVSLGLIFLLVLKALDSLNLITGLLVITATGLFVSYFRKAKRGNLTKQAKIPKLTRWQKQTSSS